MSYTSHLLRLENEREWSCATTAGRTTMFQPKDSSKTTKSAQELVNLPSPTTLHHPEIISIVSCRTKIKFRHWRLTIVQEYTPMGFQTTIRLIATVSEKTFDLIRRFLRWNFKCTAISSDECCINVHVSSLLDHWLDWDNCPVNSSVALEAALDVHAVIAWILTNVPRGANVCQTLQFQSRIVIHLVILKTLRAALPLTSKKTSL